MKKFHLGLAAGLMAAAIAPASAQVIFSTNFDGVPAPGDLEVIAFDGTVGAAAVDALSGVEFQFSGDYSLINAATAPVPEAPSSQVGDGPTAGVIINTPEGGTGAMVYYVPDTPADFRATFDFINAYPGGGGSTESFITSVYGDGNYVGYYTTTDVFGYVTFFYGDYDVAGDDIRVGEGGGGGTDPWFPNDLDGFPAIESGAALPGITWGDDPNGADIAGRDIAGGGVLNDADTSGIDDLFETALPDSLNADGTARVGCLLNAWTVVTVEMVGGVYSVSYNGNLIFSYDDPDDSFSSGKFGITFEDLNEFAGGGTNYGIIDNLVIEDLTTAVNDWALY